MPQTPLVLDPGWCAGSSSMSKTMQKHNAQLRDFEEERPRTTRRWSSYPPEFIPDVEGGKISGT